MLSFPDHVLRAAPWSISKVGVIEKCSLQFDYKYGPNKMKELVTHEQSRIGVAVHKALEMVLQGADQKKAFMIAGDEENLTADELEQLQAFWDQVRRFKLKMDTFKQKHGVRETLIEKKWGVTVQLKGCGFFDKAVFFRGVLDYGLPTARGDLIIIDHKSGKQHELSYYDKQFKSYAIMALAQNPHIKGVQTAINFIMTDQLAWNKYVTAEQIRDEYHPWLVEYLTKSCQGLLSEPVGKKSWACDWCGFKPICPVFGGSGRVEQAGQ